ncbi:hypothetical protein DPMN_014177 [Dreissena polymorpha]|uniref:Uncharacterized protein n=1 Tax=Dreissena polymorpha TaxID=45954 RepID=A0A9D4N8P2_DREPO|nr:hypothetical protein DPMN_014177 [Dreissena polymorpha]
MYQYMGAKLHRPLACNFLRNRNLFLKFSQDTIRKNEMKPVPPIGGHVFQWTGIIFELCSDIHRTNGKLTRFQRPCFSGTKTIFKRSQDIIRTNVLIKKNMQIGQPSKTVSPCFTTDRTTILTKFHEDCTIIATSRVLIMTFFHFIYYMSDIIGKKVLTKFNEGQ